MIIVIASSHKNGSRGHKKKRQEEGLSPPLSAAANRTNIAQIKARSLQSIKK